MISSLLLFMVFRIETKQDVLVHMVFTDCDPLLRISQLLFPMQKLYNTNLQDLPDEIVFEIFRYIPLKEVARLHSECLLFHNTVTRLVVGGVRTLARQITQEIQLVKKEMQTSSASADSNRLDSSTVLTYLRCMLTEAALLRATVGHYLNNDTALIFLIDPLCQILQEFYYNFTILRNSSIRKIIRADYSSPGTANWNNFLKTFDSIRKPKIEEASGIFIPVEIMIVDLLHCSVSSNLQSNFSCLYQEDKYSLNMFFQLKDIGHKGIPPNFNNCNWNEIEKQNKLIKYLRSLIRYENRAFVCKYVRELNDLENLIVLNSPNVVLDNVLEKLQNKYTEIALSPFKTISRFLSPKTPDSNVYNEIYYRENDWDVTKTGITINFKMVSDKKYLPLDYNYKITEKLYLSKKESEVGLSKEVSDTKLCTLICLSEVPRIDQSLTNYWSTTNEFCDINIDLQYDTLFTLNSLIGKEAEIIFNKSNEVVTFIHKEYEIVMA